jgi:hypothetical protein
MHRMRPGPVAALVCVLTACAANPQREARSSAGCARLVIERRLPQQPGDKLMHCVAGALIAAYCSPTEARLASVAKEIRDAFTAGDVELADVRATLDGIACARDAAPGDVAAIEHCCAGKVAATPDEPR